MSGKKSGSGIKYALANCVILAKLVNISEPQFSYQQNEKNNSVALQGCRES